ncbi:hypothetical protein ECDEC13C_0999 [Escherichia coli DEC13C]|nr:hypothetical protein ECDEC13C_0999 [Escherichia coli DEC13C]
MDSTTRICGGILELLYAAETLLLQTAPEEKTDLEKSVFTEPPRVSWRVFYL